MTNYNILFYLYLFIVLFLLLVFALFVSFQLKLLKINLLKSINLLNIINRDFSFLEKNYVNLFSLYLARSNYFFCIALSELFLEKDLSVQNRKMIYASLAFIYREICLWQIAEHYYLEVLSISPDDNEIVLILANMYSNLGHKEKSKFLYKKVSILNPNDDFLQKSIS